MQKDIQNKPKILAYFLPQFHTIPENDEWWGKGFTEWTNIKRVNKVSANLQPLNNNYYNLLDEETVKWQTDLAEKYGVFGFVYYHYYFCGKKLLEKPAENLLKNTYINQRFCFCWANHDWNRTREDTTKLLVKQEYGNEEDWSRHFNYLLPFFNDNRYIKIENKPIFIIYSDFMEKDELCKYFNHNAKKNGLNGVFFIQSISEIKISVLRNLSRTVDALVLREPSVSFNTTNKYINIIINKINILLVLLKFKSKQFINLKTFDSCIITKKTIYCAKLFCNRMRILKKKYYFGAYSGWNTTPRHNIKGSIMSNISDENYIWYLKKLKNIAIKKSVEFIFFNAWNEWSEFMILEPDTINKYRFLEGIKKVYKE